MLLPKITSVEQDKLTALLETQANAKWGIKMVA